MHAKIPDLLQYAKTLRFYEDKLAHAQGDQFNIFDVLNAGSLEAFTHTPYLAEFLDPKGSHGLGVRPLAEFIELFALELDPTTTSILPEYYLGPVTHNSGGRVDILLRDKLGHKVVVENKIYASDQSKQLYRYQNDPQLRGAKIVYLTPFGTEPSVDSTAGMTEIEKKNILQLSYANNIIAWQEEIRRQAAASPLVRETITQYINLIKSLTNQSNNTNMSDQIVKTVTGNKESLDAYFELISAKNAVYHEIWDALRIQCEKIAAPLKLKTAFSSGYRWFIFSNEDMVKQNICIGFEFASGDFSNLDFGIKYIDQNDTKKISQATIQQFQEVFGGAKSTSWWPVYTSWNAYRNWGPEVFAEVLFFDRFQIELNEKVKQLLAMTQCGNAVGAAGGINGS